MKNYIVTRYEDMMDFAASDFEKFNYYYFKIPCLVYIADSKKEMEM